jgi:hypothetical protein
MVRTTVAKTLAASPMTGIMAYNAGSDRNWCDTICAEQLKCAGRLA